jgi:hypothetical protein
VSRTEVGWTVTARWSGRGEAPEVVADRLSRFLRGIAHVHPSFSVWYRAGTSTRVRLDAASLDAALHRHEAGSTTGGAVGLGLTTATRTPTELRCWAATPGAAGDARSIVSVEVRAAVAEELAPDALDEVLRAMVEAWDPEWGSCWSTALGEAQLAVPGSVVVGRATYLSTDPSVIGVMDGVRVEPFGGGTLVTHGGPSAQPTVDQVRALRRRLTDRGVLDTSETAALSGGPAGLTVHEAFLAMTDYLTGFHQRGPGAVLEVLIGARIEPDGGTGDPAVWHDWLDSVTRIRSGAAPRSVFESVTGGPSP